MIGIGWFDHATGSLHLVLAMMANPTFAHDFGTKFLKGDFSTKGSIIQPFECMSGCTYANNRFSIVKKPGDIFGVFGRWIAKTSTNNHDVCLIQMVPTFDPPVVVWINVISSLIPRKQNFTGKSVPFCQNFSKHRHTFLGSILFIP